MAQSGPKESVQGIEFWPWPFSFEYGDLLSEGQNFEGGIPRLRKNTRMPTMNERMSSSTNSPL